MFIVLSCIVCVYCMALCCVNVFILYWVVLCDCIECVVLCDCIECVVVAEEDSRLVSLNADDALCSNAKSCCSFLNGEMTLRERHRE